MWFLKVEIAKFADADHYPGWVECRIEDAAGQVHTFIEKVPLVSSEDLWTESAYPRAVWPAKSWGSGTMTKDGISDGLRLRLGESSLPKAKRVLSFSQRS
jgi:hypothetical protein